jgi:hypothetical protein
MAGGAVEDPATHHSVRVPLGTHQLRDNTLRKISVLDAVCTVFTRLNSGYFEDSREDVKDLSGRMADGMLDLWAHQPCPHNRATVDRSYRSCYSLGFVPR